MDSWVYPALDRLMDLGIWIQRFLACVHGRGEVFSGCSTSVAENGIESNSQAAEILAALQREFGVEDNDPSGLSYGCDDSTLASRVFRANLAGQLSSGQTLVNDYGRPTSPASTPSMASAAARSLAVSACTRAANISMRRAPQAILRLWSRRYGTSIRRRVPFLDYLSPPIRRRQPSPPDDRNDRCTPHSRSEHFLSRSEP